MTQVKLNKSSLSVERKNLKNYQQFLPSLELKRQKILFEKNKASNEFEEMKKQLEAHEKQLSDRYPMAANSRLDANELIKIKSLEINTENIVGVNIPVFKAIEFTLTKYDYFNTPHWLENFISDMKQLIELKLRWSIATESVELLDKALRTVTQRKNLFEKVLIPKSKKTIRMIQIFLADNERAGVVCSKIAKKKRQIE